MAEAVCFYVYGFWVKDGSASSHDGIHTLPLLIIWVASTADRTALKV
jgi:hypothetical protein